MLEPPLIDPPTRDRSGSEEMPRLVRELFLQSRPLFKNFDMEKFVQENAENAYSHHIFTFNNWPGWRIDAYQFSWEGIPTEFVLKVTALATANRYCRFKDGLEFHEWTGMLGHDLTWFQTPECKAEMAEKQTNIIPPPPAYIKGCSCIICDRDKYDGVTWDIKNTKRGRPKQK
jgi:hypothetical protein